MALGKSIIWIDDTFGHNLTRGIRSTACNDTVKADKLEFALFFDFLMACRCHGQAMVGTEIDTLRSQHGSSE